MGVEHVQVAYAWSRRSFGGTCTRGGFSKPLVRVSGNGFCSIIDASNAVTLPNRMRTTPVRATTLIRGCPGRDTASTPCGGRHRGRGCTHDRCARASARAAIGRGCPGRSNARGREGSHRSSQKAAAAHGCRGGSEKAAKARSRRARRRTGVAPEPKPTPAGSARRRRVLDSDGSKRKQRST